MEIRCKKGNCEFNTGCSCKAKKVDISNGTAACTTYTKDPNKNNIVIENGNLFDAAKGMPAKNTLNVPLQCAAIRCIYNKTEKCIANGILVIDDQTSSCDAEAACATFVEK